MINDWYFAQNDERQGPIPFDRLESMAKEGWLRPDDLVWKPGLPAWTPAKKVPGLFRGSLLQMASEALLGRPTISASADEAIDEDARPPALPEKPSRRRKKRRARSHLTHAWQHLAPRHLLTAAGGFLAALGIAFTVIAQTRLALAITLGGLFILAVGLAPEIGRLAAEALDNIGDVIQDAAYRRLRAEKLALENRWIDLEAARLAHQEKGLDRLLPAEPVPQARAATAAVSTPPAVAADDPIVISEPPTKLWSPGLAVALSLFVPGLGQLYKGQLLNGVVWFVVVMLGYAALIVPGLFLHFFCVLGALSGNPWNPGRTTVVRKPAMQNTTTSL